MFGVFHTDLQIKIVSMEQYAMDNVTEMLTLTYYFYKGSAKRNKEVAQVAEIMEEHSYKPEKDNLTRWVDHKL